MIKAVIFDMFETLVTLFSGPVFMGKQIAEEIGIAEAKFREIWDPSDHERTLGKRTLEDVIEEILRVNNCYSTELLERILAKREEVTKRSFERKHIHPEIIPLFTWFKEQNIKIGLISNCYFEERDIIKNSVLNDYFDVMCMSCELGMKKPDVRIFQKCMEDLGLEPAECLYIGDGGSLELETAESVGMNSLQAAWYLKDELKQPARRKPEFAQAESPLGVIAVIKEISQEER
jgi:putative hydrolase of the HAD superfamily